MKNMQSQFGGALIYVLGIVAALGLLFATLVQWKTSDLQVYGNTRLSSQTELVTLGGLSYGLSYLSRWMGSGGSKKRNIEYTGNLREKTLPPPSTSSEKHLPESFSLSILPQGMYSYIQSTGAVGSQENKPQNKHRRGGIVGQAFSGTDLSGSDFPALVVRSKQGGLAIGGTGQVLGDIVLRKGAVQKATHSKVKFKGGAPHQGSILDSSSSTWHSTIISYRKADIWIRKREQMYRADSLLISTETPYITMVQDGITRLNSSSSSGSFGSVTRNTLFRSPQGKTLFISGGTYQNCEFLAENIVITGSPTFQNTLAYASRNISIQGTPSLGGQFMAVDSLTIDVSVHTPSSSQMLPVFYLHGGFNESFLSLAHFVGEGVFLFRNRYRMGNPHTVDSRTHVWIGPEVRISGLVSVSGNVDHRGTVMGSLICDNFAFYKEGTLFTGHLYEGTIQSFRAMGSSRIYTTPLLFPKGGPAKILYQEVLPL